MAGTAAAEIRRLASVKSYLDIQRRNCFFVLLRIFAFRVFLVVPSTLFKDSMFHQTLNAECAIFHSYLDQTLLADTL